MSRLSLSNWKKAFVGRRAPRLSGMSSADLASNYRSLMDRLQDPGTRFFSQVLHARDSCHDRDTFTAIEVDQESKLLSEAEKSVLEHIIQKVDCHLHSVPRWQSSGPGTGNDSRRSGAFEALQAVVGDNATEEDASALLTATFDASAVKDAERDPESRSRFRKISTTARARRKYLEKSSHTHPDITNDPNDSYDTYTYETEKALDNVFLSSTLRNPVDPWDLPTESVAKVSGSGGQRASSPYHQNTQLQPSGAPVSRSASVYSAPPTNTNGDFSEPKRQESREEDEADDGDMRGSVADADETQPLLL